MKKNIFGIILAIMMVFTSTPASASDSVASQNSSAEPIIISQEQINVDGVPVIFTLYNDNGVIVETASVGDNISAKSKSSTLEDSEEIDSNQLKAKIAEIADQRFAERSNKMQTRGSGSNTFNYSKQNSVNPNCYVGHWSDYSYNFRMINLLAYEGSVNFTNGGVRGLYSGGGNADKIVLNETITKYGTTLTFSYPWSIGATGSNNSKTWTSSDYTNTSIATYNRPNFGGEWTNFILSTKLLDIESGSDIYLSNTAYGTKTSVGITAL